MSAVITAVLAIWVVAIPSFVIALALLRARVREAGVRRNPLAPVIRFPQRLVDIERQPAGSSRSVRGI